MLDACPHVKLGKGTPEGSVELAGKVRRIAPGFRRHAPQGEIRAPRMGEEFGNLAKPTTCSRAGRSGEELQFALRSPVKEVHDDLLGRELADRIQPTFESVESERRGRDKAVPGETRRGTGASRTTHGFQPLSV